MKQLIEYITVEEFSKLMRAEKGKKFRLAYLLAFGSGLRISEIIGYKRKDNKEIKPLTADQVNIKANQIRIIGGKGMKDRIVPVPPRFTDDHLKMLPLQIKRSTLQAHFKALCKRILKKPCNFHMLRHGFANFLVNEKNVPLPYVQQLMGHSRLDTTGIYTKANPVKAIAAATEAWGI